MPELDLDESTVLHGRGLVLRTWLPEDLDALLEACQDPEIQHWTPLPSPYLPEHAELFLDACALRWVHGLASFAILDRDETCLLGSIGFVGLPEDGVVEVGYWVAPSARGRGVATAATGVICDWAFGTLEFNRVEWQAYVGNEGSRRVAERCGFTFEGTLRGRGYQRGEYRDIWIAGLLRSDGRPDVPDATGHQSAGS
ncbi:GNAT family N-acetyltransferase [Nakamurella sp. PAMC28650]|uniref:GNAT family N-acetyltransferase n=1 Tax=Nakamurella sp. PAMC28650 TaxID=2762325 RepID=UPI00164DD5A1|nr:GNAT family protein [Nakamurella sp. PAMC28650]QNK81710.1 GNAT family N-acetyltransferase [Nakamurella sp. PAMC28650]